MQTIHFEREKETKNTIRFIEVPKEGVAPVIGTLYVQKWFAGSKQKLTIEVKDE